MPRNGAGTYNRTNGFYSGATTWAQSKTAGLPMTDNTLHDTHDQDIADALSATLDATGQNPRQRTSLWRDFAIPERIQPLTQLLPEQAIFR